jgi:hypothetical protein
MPYRYALLTLALACLLLWVTPVSAQAGWQAWLYDANNLRMTLVSEAGFLRDFVLPVEGGFDLFPQRVAVAHGGGIMAYTIANSRNFASLLLLARSDGSYMASAIPLTGNTAATILADSLQYSANEFIFDETDSSLALGYSLVDGGWEIVVFSTENLQELHRLRSNDPLLAVLGLPSQQGITPIIQRNQAGTITFTLIMTGTEGAAEYPSYTWNVDTNAVTVDIAYPSLDNDTLAATGEVIMSMADDRLPNTSGNFIFFQANSLHVYDPVQNGRYPFYNQPDVSLHSPRFVQGGERVLAAASDAAGTAITWQVIERSGALLGPIPTPMNITSVEGVPDGFVYTTDTFNPGTTTLVFVNTRDGLDAGVPAWTSAPGATPQIMWTGSPGFTAQTALPGWAQLAAPVPGKGAPLGGMSLDVGGGAAIVSPGDLPTPAPVSGGILVIGGQATINTTEGDTLNVRGGPGTSFPVVGRLPAGTRVTLVEGPRAGEGFTWWRIRAGNLEGWVVESVEDRGTRLQTLLP